MQDEPNMDGIDTKEPTAPPELPNLNLNVMLPRNAKLNPHRHAMHAVGCNTYSTSILLDVCFIITS
jgi:hypothetical protein